MSWGRNPETCFSNITYLLKRLHFLTASRGTSASRNIRLYLDTGDADDGSITFLFFLSLFLQRQRQQCWNHVYTLGSAGNFPWSVPEQIRDGTFPVLQLCLRSRPGPGWWKPHFPCFVLKHKSVVSPITCPSPSVPGPCSVCLQTGGIRFPVNA